MGVKNGLASESHGKVQHSVFNPVPKSKLRPLSTDRPNVTESPYTVDAGWYQLEMSVAISRLEGDQQSTSYLLSNIKVGLTDDMDLQLIVDPLNYNNGQRVQNNSQMRLKINLFGNDSGDLAVALLPFVTFADGEAATHNSLEGGFSVPVTIVLPKNWSLGVMTQWNWSYQSSLNGYKLNYLTSFSIGRKIKENLSGFLEYAAASSVDHPSLGAHQLGLGVTYLQTPMQQWDVGIFSGLTEANIDYAPFLGYSLKF